MIHSELEIHKIFQIVLQIFLGMLNLAFLGKKVMNSQVGLRDLTVKGYQLVLSKQTLPQPFCRLRL